MKKAVNSRFKMLRTVALILKVLSYVSLLGGIAVAIILVIDPSRFAQLGFTMAYQYVWLCILATLITTVIYAIVFFALAEHIYVYLSIEENTRKLRELLDKK